MTATHPSPEGTHPPVRLVLTVEYLVTPREGMSALDAISVADERLRLNIDAASGILALDPKLPEVARTEFSTLATDEETGEELASW